MHFINYVINLIYPNTCGFCDKICSESICPKCKIEAKKYMICNIHNYSDISFTRHMYIFKYDGIIREKIVQYKFNDKPYIYESFVNLILKNEKTCNFLKSYDIIIPVPISKKRKQKRGYNQSELIAKKISKSIERLTLVTNVLTKKIDIVPQSSLSKTNRINNVKDAYDIKNAEIIKNKKIIIIDDVFTTGSTVEECSRILKNAGAKIVDVLTIAKD